MQKATDEAKTKAPTKKARTVIKPKDETPEQTFVRLAKYRMNKLMARVDQIEVLARYPHTQEQGKAIVDTMFDSARRVQAAFEKTKKGHRFDF